MGPEVVEEPEGGGQLSVVGPGDRVIALAWSGIRN
jgi:hypothetical protein